MKVSISYPPIVNELGQKAMVSQNRNVQFFKEPTYLLPVTYAQAGTWLKNEGHDVYWDDGNAQLKTYDEWFADLVAWIPDMIVVESTTPTMKFYWQTITELKAALPDSIIVMTGYHAMRKPEETLDACPADIVLLSNHVDFALHRLVDFIAAHPDWRAICELEGLVIRQKADDLIASSGPEYRHTGSFRQVEPLDN